MLGPQDRWQYIAPLFNWVLIMVFKKKESLFEVQNVTQPCKQWPSGVNDKYIFTDIECQLHSWVITQQSFDELNDKFEIAEAGIFG